MTPAGGRWLASAGVALVAATGCAGPSARMIRWPHPLAGLESGWNRIPGPAGTTCAPGTPYAFYARPGHPRQLTVILQGGGACWNAPSCDPAHADPIFDGSVEASDDPSGKGGLFDLTDPRNPIREDSIVLLPYCTGDLHLGGRDVRYALRDSTGAIAREFTVRHQGAANVDATLQWVFEKFPSLDRVFVVGMSAGAVPSPLYAGRFASRYPEAHVVQIGDGAGGYRSPVATRLLSGWGALAPLRRDPTLAALDTNTVTFQTFYLVSARTAPRVVRSQVNTAEDARQLFFLRAIGVSATSLAPLIAANLEEIRRADPAFRSYTAPGTRHTTLTGVEFYTEQVNGIALRDWVADLLEEGRVPDVGP